MGPVNDKKHLFERMQQISRGYWESSILFTGVKVGLFNVLDGQPIGQRGVSDISNKLITNGRATEILLNALAALGLVIKRGDQYRNHPFTTRYLVSGKSDYRGHMLLHSLDMWKQWGELSEILYSGSPATDLVDRLEENKERVEHFILAMHELAREPAEKIARLVRPRSVKRFLDVGGGPGTYCFAMLKKNPDISATIIDLKLPLQIAKGLITEKGLTKSIRLVEGNFLETDFGEGYDLVLLSQILHSNSPEECELLIKKGYLALKDGGRLVVHDFILNEDKVSPPSAAIFAVNMLVNTERGRTYTEGEIREWMEGSNFKDFTLYDITPQSRAIVARR